MRRSARWVMVGMLGASSLATTGCELLELLGLGGSAQPGLQSPIPGFQGGQDYANPDGTIYGGGGTTSLSPLAGNGFLPVAPRSTQNGSLPPLFQGGIQGLGSQPYSANAPTYAGLTGGGANGYPQPSYQPSARYQQPMYRGENFVDLNQPQATAQPLVLAGARPAGTNDGSPAPMRNQAPTGVVGADVAGADEWTQVGGVEEEVPAVVSSAVAPSDTSSNQDRALAPVELSDTSPGIDPAQVSPDPVQPADPAGAADEQGEDFDWNSYQESPSGGESDSAPDAGYGQPAPSNHTNQYDSVVLGGAVFRDSVNA